MSSFDQTAQSVRAAAVAFERSAQTINTSVARITEQVEPLGQDTRATLQETSRALQAVSQASQTLERELGRTLQFVQSDGARLAQQADAAVDTSMHELRATAAELRTSAELISRTLDRLQDPRALLLGPSPQQLGPGEHAQP